MAELIHPYGAMTFIPKITDVDNMGTGFGYYSKSVDPSFDDYGVIASFDNGGRGMQLFHSYYSDNFMARTRGNYGEWSNWCIFKPDSTLATE